MYVYMSSLVCLRVYVKDSGEEKFKTEEGRKILNGRKIKQSTLRAVSVLFLHPICSRSCVFIGMFCSSSSNSAPFYSQVHVCQWLLLSLSSLNVLDQIIFSLVFIFIITFQIHQFFLKNVILFMCFIFIPH